MIEAPEDNLKKFYHTSWEGFPKPILRSSESFVKPQFNIGDIFKCIY